MHIRPDTPNSYDNFVQEYAKGGISAAVLLNSGASVALLSQVGKLLDLGLKSPISAALVIWSVGVVSGAAAWIFALVSSRYVSRSLNPNVNVNSDLKISDRWMYTGIVSVLCSLLAFIIGVGVMAYSFSNAEVDIDIDSMLPWERYELLEQLQKRSAPLTVE